MTRDRHSVRARLALCALAALAAVAGSGCAPRVAPKDEIVTTVAPAPGARLVTVLVATTREPSAASGVSFTARRAQELRYARYVVSIPPGHKPAEVEDPQGAPDPRRTFAVVDARPLSEAEFLAGVKADARRGRFRDGVGVFVHGYNYTFEESLFRRAQLAVDANVPGAAVLFAWPSAASATAYVADRDATLVSRDGLAHLLTLLASQRDLKVVSFSHSLGSVLQMEALRQMKLAGRTAEVDRLEDVVLAAPDIDVDVFISQLRTVGRLTPPLTVLVSKDDSALSISQALAGGRRRVGAADVDNPRVQDAAKRFDVRVIDISELAGAGGLNHDRYAAMAAIYPKLRGQLDARAGGPLSKAGAYLLDASSASPGEPPRAAAAEATIRPVAAAR